MTLEWRGRTLVITWLPVASMGRLAACAPQTAAETEVLAALLAGARVRVERTRDGWSLVTALCTDGYTRRAWMMDAYLRR